MRFVPVKTAEQQAAHLMLSESVTGIDPPTGTQSTRSRPTRPDLALQRQRGCHLVPLRETYRGRSEPCPRGWELFDVQAGEFETAGAYWRDRGQANIWHRPMRMQTTSRARSLEFGPIGAVLLRIEDPGSLSSFIWAAVRGWIGWTPRRIIPNRPASQALGVINTSRREGCAEMVGMGRPAGIRTRMQRQAERRHVDCRTSQAQIAESCRRGTTGEQDGTHRMEDDDDRGSYDSRKSVTHLAGTV